jgi:hypothetical protein
MYKVNAYRRNIILKVVSFYDDTTEALYFHQMKHELSILKNVLLVARKEINFKGEFHFWDP